jgi:signal transduction histidine kinase
MDRTQFTVLIVDDEPDIREVLEIALTDSGYPVLLADNGQAALACFAENPPAIVVTDIRMPVMDGIALLRQIKQISPDTEVVMITGHGDMDMTIQSLKYGAMDFITKPVHVDILELSVNRAAEKIIARRQLADYTSRLELLVMEKSRMADHLSALGLMIGTISHNIKGLLTNLDGGLYLVRSGMKHARPRDTTDGLDILEQSISRIRQLILDILMYSRERQMNPVPVPTDAFVADIRKTLEMKLSRVPVTGRVISEKAPPTLVVDPPFLNAALVNILDNAVDACLADTEKKDHEIRLTIKRADHAVSFEIRDNGCGMDLKTREKIFDLFFSSKATSGTGFGLFITHSIVTQHQGTIRVDSVKHKGSVFTITLPQPA